jgi:hypothetical protein
VATFQTRSQYSRIARSDEKRPTRAAFTMAMRVHARESRHGASTGHST